MMTLEKDIATLKISSGLVLNEDGNAIDHDAIADWSAQIAEVNEYFHPVLVVGGATGAGREFLINNGRSHEDYDRQVLASLGTAAVSLAIRDELMQEHGIESGQVLANHDQLKKPGTVLIKGILNGILRHGNVYNINENDQESLFEIELLEEEEKKEERRKKLGIDNDRLGAQLTIALIKELKDRGYSEELAVHLVMFTEVGGFLDNGAVSKQISGSKREEIYGKCEASKSSTGTGGMAVKVEACFDAVDAGAGSVYIASPDQTWLNILLGKAKKGMATRVVQ